MEISHLGNVRGQRKMRNDRPQLPAKLLADSHVTTTSNFDDKICNKVCPISKAAIAFHPNCWKLAALGDD